MKKILTLLNVVVVGILLAAAENSSVQNVLGEKNTQAIITLSVLRDLGGQGRLVEQMPDNLKKKWFNDLQKFYVDKQSPFILDFFRNSLLFVGPGDKESNIVAIYDPWSDNILLLRISSILIPPVIREYRFLPGAIFRGENINESYLSQTVLATKLPLEIALLKATADTRKQFIKRFPGDMKNITLSSVPVETAQSIKIMQTGMAVRFNAAMDILNSDNKELFAKVVLCNRLVREATNAELINFFEKSAGMKKMLTTLSLQTSELRKAYRFAGISRGKNADTFAYANQRIPTLVICIEIPKNKAECRMTVLDLGLAEDILKTVPGIGGNK